MMCIYYTNIFFLLFFFYFHASTHATTHAPHAMDVACSVCLVPFHGEYKSYGLGGTSVVQAGPINIEIPQLKNFAYLFGPPRKRVFYGKEYLVPRLEAVITNDDVCCGYSKDIPRFKWHGFFYRLRREVCVMFDTRFNYAIVNFYRDGKDYVAAHCDDEVEIEQTRPIVTVSYGEARTFRIRDKTNKKIVLDLKTGSGTVIAMYGENFQAHFTHEIAKQSANVVRSPRMSVTFRCVKGGKQKTFNLL